MQNIRSLKDSVSSELRRKRIGGIIIIALLLLSTLGFAISFVGLKGDTSSLETQGFTYNGQYWVYTASTQKYYFTYHIDEVNASSYIISKNIADFAGKQIYVDSDTSVASQEIYTNLASYSRISEACYGTCNKDLPEKNCSGEQLIVIRQSQSSSIREQESCTFIDGDMKTVDAFLYNILGIR